MMEAFTLAALLAASPAPAAPTAADALFSAAREARSQSSYAHYAVYATVVRFRRGTREMTSTWDTVEDTRRRMVHAHSLSREENASPHVPRGINVGVSGGPSGMVLGMPARGRIVNPEPSDDPIGQLTFAVDQDFGLALNAPPIAASPSMSEVSSSVTTLRQIGRTGTFVRTYEITDLGDVNENGTLVHHLGLKPLGDPRRYRLRELWTDAKTSLPARAIVAGVGNRGPLTGVDWRIEFVQLQGGTYIERERALGPIDTSDGRLENVSISFEALRPTNRLTSVESLGLSGDVGITDP